MLLLWKSISLSAGAANPSAGQVNTSTAIHHTQKKWFSFSRVSMFFLHYVNRQHKITEQGYLI